MRSINHIRLELKGLLKYLGQVAIWALKFQWNDLHNKHN